MKQIFVYVPWVASLSCFAHCAEKDTILIFFFFFDENFVNIFLTLDTGFTHKSDDLDLKHLNWESTQQHFLIKFCCLDNKLLVLINRLIYFPVLYSLTMSACLNMSWKK